MFTFKSALSFYLTKFVTKQDEWQNLIKKLKLRKNYPKTTFEIPMLWIIENHTSKMQKKTVIEVAQSSYNYIIQSNNIYNYRSYSDSIDSVSITVGICVAVNRPT